MMAMLLSSCAIIGQEKPASDFCTLARPFYINKKDVCMSDDLARDILAHNKKGKTFCGWKSN